MSLEKHLKMSLEKKKVKVYSADVKTSSSNIYEYLIESDKFREWFPDSHISYEEDEYLKNLVELSNNNIHWLFVIEDWISNKEISGTLKSTDPDSESRFFSFVLIPLKVPGWTHISLTVESRLQKHTVWPLITIPPGLVIMNEFFVNVGHVYGATATGATATGATATGATATGATATGATATGATATGATATGATATGATATGATATGATATGATATGATATGATATGATATGATATGATATGATATGATATGATVASILSAKSISVPIFAAILVTSGVYVADIEIFETNPNFISFDILPQLDNAATVAVKDDTLSEGTTVAVKDDTLSEGTTVAVKDDTLSEGTTVAVKDDTLSEGTTVAVKDDTLSEGTTVAVKDDTLSEGTTVAVESIQITSFTSADYTTTPKIISNIDTNDIPDFKRNVAVDKNENIVTVNLDEDSITISNPQGDIIKKFGESGKGDGKLNGAKAIAIGSIIVADSHNHRIQKFDSKGNFMFKFGGKGISDGQFSYPYAVATDRDGNIIVADTGNHRIQKFDSKGNFMFKFGEYGSSNGQFINPLGIATDRDGNIIVLDPDVSHNSSQPPQVLYYNDFASAVPGIQIFDPDGNFIAKYNYDPPKGYPSTHITIDTNGNIIVGNNGGAIMFSFPDAITAFTKSFDEISCNANSMINEPISIPPEIVLALSISELLPRANSFAETEQFEESLLFYYVASQIDPANVHAWNGIGYSQTFLCDNNSAIDAYSHTLTLDKNNVNTFNGLGFFYAGHAQAQSRNNAPDDLVESTASLAIANYEKTFQINSHNVNALNGIGTVHIILEQHDAAIKLFEKSLEIEPNRIATTNGMAFAQLRSGNPVSAITYYEMTLSADQNNFDALSGLLSIYIQQDRQSDINETVYRLAQYQDEIVESLITEGKWFAERSQSEEAKRFFEKALELDRGNELARELLNEIS